MHRAPVAAAVLAALSLVLAGCSDADEPGTAETPSVSESTESSPSAEPSESESGDATPSGSATSEDEAIEIEIEGDRVEPNGLRVKIAAGETVTLAVESDRAAEFHVHSSPEQVLEVQQGRSTIDLVIERPGLVDVEEHESGQIIVQLEVR